VDRIELDDVKLNYLEIDEARKMSGLRLILGAYTVPGPWRESCKGLFYVKGLDYASARTANQDRGDAEFGANGAASVLEEWTGQTSAPVAVWNDERPRSTWVDQIYLADRLNPEPPLLPDGLEARAEMIGLIHLICGEQGLGWNLRHLIIKNGLAGLPPEDPWYPRIELLGKKYGYSPEAGDAASQRAAEILGVLSRRLMAREKSGSRYYFGDRLSALDIYSACFSSALSPLPQDLCPMSTDYRPSYTCEDPAITSALAPRLLPHRDFIYETHLELPIVF
jgi:glutathione S-transferase